MWLSQKGTWKRDN